MEMNDSRVPFFQTTPHFGRTGHIILAAVSTAIACVIVFTNVITLIAICKFKNFKNGTNYLIFSLALADLSLGMVIPFCAVTAFQAAPASILCKLCVIWKVVSLSVSLVTIVCIALERFFAVVFPLKHRVVLSGRRKGVFVFVIAFTWTYEFCLCLLNGFGESIRCTGFTFSPWLSIVYITTILVSFVLCTFSYVKIHVAAVAHFRMVHSARYGLLLGAKSSSCSQRTGSESLPSAEKPNPDNDDREDKDLTSEESQPHFDVQDGVPVCSHDHTEHHHPSRGHSCAHTHTKESENPGTGGHKDESVPKYGGSKCKDCYNIKVARMTLLVLIVFVLCWLPFVVVNVANVLLRDNVHSEILHVLFDVSLQILYCNSFMNPILYSWQSLEYRTAFKILLKRFFRPKTCSCE